jgi:hypothetical protein
VAFRFFLIIKNVILLEDMKSITEKVSSLMNKISIHPTRVRFREDFALMGNSRELSANNLVMLIQNILIFKNNLSAIISPIKLQNSFNLLLRQHSQQKMQEMKQSKKESMKYLNNLIYEELVDETTELSLLLPHLKNNKRKKLILTVKPHEEKR